ncbi:MAG: ankyrin repeat domain-containing protein [Planctomycetes bacterium]|nr:ankyrin repeat domain-containing protein [Planctomycetota bacterium]
MIRPLAATLSALLLALPTAAQQGAQLHERASAAVDRSLPLLQQSAATWIERRSCVSCHHQGAGLLALGHAVAKGFAIDAALFDGQVAAIRDRFRRSLASLKGGGGVINFPFGHAYVTVALAGAGATPADGSMQVFVHGAAGRQHVSGSWRSESHRPPIEDSPVTITALALRSLQLFAVPGRQDEMRERVAKATAWLERTEATSTEEAVFRLWGLGWGDAASEVRERAVRELLAQQRDDGGWAQLPTLASDAYATGSALLVLHDVGGVATDSAAYVRGVERLLALKQPDGSWHTRTRRRLPGLPYFETGFPHGIDQFVSYAASAWATMALVTFVRPGRSAAFWPDPEPAPALEAIDPAVLGEGATALHRAALFGDGSQLAAALGDGAEVDAATEDGLTSLMLAIHDPRRVQQLLDRGADVARSLPGRLTALELAAGYGGNGDTIDRLLAAGATIARPGRIAGRAAAGGDLGKLERLLAAGANLAPVGKEPPPLLIATGNGDVAMVRRLLAAGAAIDASYEGFTSLLAAAADGNLVLVRELLAAGAAIDHADEEGLTALVVAAMHDPGHDEIVAALLAAGADVRKRAGEFGNALDVARAHHHPALPLLERAMAKDEGSRRNGGR